MMYGRMTILAMAVVAQTGCSAEFWGGTAAGVLGAGAGYEYSAKRQMDKLEEEYREGRITQEEYEDRKRQIERGSILY